MILVDNIVSKSLLAGLSIGVGCFIFLSCNNPILGALLFSVGLSAVVVFNLNLFTGRSGFISDANDARRLILVLLLNLISAFLFGLLSSLLCTDLQISADELVSNRLTTNLPSFVIKSVVTGFLMTLAVESEKNSSNHLIMFLSVMSFILAGCYHCIADSFYYGASSLLFDNIGSISIRLIITILFNFIGCCLYTIFVNKSLVNRL